MKQKELLAHILTWGILFVLSMVNKTGIAVN